MSDQNSIFNAGSTDPVPAAPAASSVPQESSFADLLGSIKNERGEPKYRDVQTALDALKHSQDFIPTLKSELEREKAEKERLAAEVERLKTVEASVAQLTAQQTQQASPAPVGLKADDVASLVDKVLTQREIQNMQQANISKVASVMQQNFGEHAEKQFYDKAKELGMQPAQINALAAQSPEAVFRMLGVAPPKSQGSVVPPASSVNTTGYQPQQQSYVTRNAQGVLFGAESGSQIQEQRNANALVEELAAKGMSVHDLSDPKVFFKHFKK